RHSAHEPQAKHWLTLTAVGTAIVSLVAVSAAGQTPPAAVKTAAAAKPAPAKRWTPPRTAWGDPDLQGTWPGTPMMGVPLQRPAELAERRVLTDAEFAAREEQARRQAQADSEVFAALRAPGGVAGNTGGPGHWGERGQPQRQTSLIVDPPDGRMPLMTPEGQKRTAAIPATLYYDNNGGGPFNGPEDLSVYDRCITRGVIGSTLPVGYNAGNQIVQGPGYVAIRYEMIHEARLIPLDGRPHGSPNIRTYMGDPRGHWEGDTLVVETTNFNGKTGVTGNGRATYTSDAIRLLERFTRVDADTIQYEATIDDPKMWTRPWTVAFPLKRRFINDDQLPFP
ncbi:MAG: hypothetical protein AAB289_07210, partial [Chloroflexota bacterium]